jgi:hypothetical protein
VALVNKTLPLEFAVLGASEVAVTVTAGQTTTVDFPAVRTGQIQGVVFGDENRNGVQDSNEKVLPGLMVQVEECDVISFTNERGEFTLSNLPTKSWKVLVDTGAMNGDYEMSNSKPLEIQVKPNDKITNVQLGVAMQNRSIINTFSKVE